MKKSKAKVDVKLTQDDVDRLGDIELEIENLLHEATLIVNKSASFTTRERFRQYVKAHLEMALNHDHEWLGGCSTTLRDIIKELTEERGTR